MPVSLLLRIVYFSNSIGVAPLFASSEISLMVATSKPSVLYSALYPLFVVNVSV